MVSWCCSIVRSVILSHREIQLLCFVFFFSCRSSLVWLFVGELQVMAARWACVACLSLLAVVSGDPCLIISEINADNPRLDTTEFVELYHTGGQRASLDGYTLVFYNGNGNVAYKVLDLKGHSTDDRGFFLVGSVDMLPKPAILLPPNTVQNGPDAIVLYHTSASRYGEKMNVTSLGMVDAVVYMTRRTGGAEFLAETLTPGEPAFVEDEAALEGDESIERCLLSEDRWGFQVSSPSPGQRNNCTPPAGQAPIPVITELKLGAGQVDGFVELTEAPAAGPLVLVVLDGRTDRVSVSVDVNVDTSSNGLISMTIEKTYMKGQCCLGGPGTRRCFSPSVHRVSRLKSFVFHLPSFFVPLLVSPQEMSRGRWPCTVAEPQISPRAAN